jgi:hypothetical protein
MECLKATTRRSSRTGQTIATDKAMNQDKEKIEKNHDFDEASRGY